MPAAEPATDLIVLGRVPTTRDYVRDLWSRRQYAWEVPLSAVRAAHMNTLLGNLWHLINPLLMVAVYYLIFGVIIGTDRGIDNFLAYLSVGVFTFRFAQNSIQNCAGSIVGNDGLIRSIYFPRALLPITVVIQHVLTLIPSIAVLLIIIVLSGHSPMLGWFLLPVVYALQTMFNLGAGFFAARITDTFRDFQNLLPFVFRILFYASGVLFSINANVESDVLRNTLHANPFYAFIAAARWALLGEPLDTVVMAAILVWPVVTLASGFLFFKAAESRYGRG